MKDVIDELSLKIDIDVEKGIDKTISSLARAITKLNSAVSNVSGLQKYVNSLSKMTAKSAKATANTSVAKVTGATKQPKYQDVPDGAVETTQQLNDVQKSSEQASKSIGKLGGNLAKTSKWFKQVNKETKQNTKETEKNAKSNEKSSNTFNKLVRSIGRIAFYRAIRTAVKEVTDAFREGFANFVQYDEETNKSMSNVMNSVNQLKNTLGVGLGSVLQMLEPVIVSISNSLVNMADGINMALAKMQGKSTYQKAIKQNEDYAKSLNKVNASLFTFDKFESLSQDDSASPSSMFEEVEVPDELPESAKIWTEIFEIVNEIVDVIKSLSRALSPVFEVSMDMLRQILPIVTDIIGYVGDFIQMLDDIGLLEPLLWGIVAALAVVAIKQAIVAATNPFTLILIAIAAVTAGIVALIQNWDKVVEGFKNGIEKIKGWFDELKEKWNESFVGKAVNKVKGGIQWIGEKINLFADGASNIPKGTQFIAGEAGAEVVSTSARGTGVTNIEQFTNAMYNALSLYGVARSTDVQFGGDVYVDRTKVGQLVEGAVYNEGVRVGHFAKRR